MGSNLAKLKAKKIIQVVFLLSFSAFDAMALTSLPIQVNVQKNETVEFIPVFKDVPVNAVELAPATVQPPLHGTLSTIPAKTCYWKQQRPLTPAWKKIPVTWYRYVPNDPGFTGVDSFTFQVTDGAGNTSNTVTAVLRIHPPEPGGMTVLIVATLAVLTPLAAEINRLKSDLENEGYSARIISFSGTAGALRDTLSAEYNRPAAFMAGALLVGNVGVTPYPLYEKPYWNMSFRTDSGYFFKDSLWSAFGANNSLPAYYDTSFGSGYLSPTYNRSLLHIWIGRFFGAGVDGKGVSAYGSEAGLIKRQLDANHDYRTNASRYPRKAYAYDLYASKNFNESLLRPLVPDVVRDPRDGRTFTGKDTLWRIFTVYQPGQAGQLWYLSCEMNYYKFYISLQGGTTYWPLHPTDTIMNRPFQQRFAFFEGCHSGQTGGIVNAHLFTRGSGCVFAVGPASYRYGNYRYCLADTTTNPASGKFRTLLTAGERVGSAWIRADVGNSSYYLFGDPSLRPNMDSANLAPVVDSLVRSRPGAGKFRFTAAARDPDGAVQTYEWWFNKTYSFGRNEPDSITTVPIIEVDSSRCTTWVRLEIVDQWKARSYAVIPKGADRSTNPFMVPEARPLPLQAGVLSVLPNPFHRTTRFAFSMDKAAPVTLSVLDAQGRRVRNLTDNGFRSIGTHSVEWDGRDGRGVRAAAGIYIVRLKTATGTLCRRITIL